MNFYLAQEKGKDYVIEIIIISNKSLICCVNFLHVPLTKDTFEFVKDAGYELRSL